MLLYFLAGAIVFMFGVVTGVAIIGKFMEGFMKDDESPSF